MELCEVCGNPIDGQSLRCKFCGSNQNSHQQKKHPFSHKFINLEQGRPVVEAAIQRLLTEIQQAQVERIQILTLIHGYGSSGKGGLIRQECRKMLDHLKGQKEINDFIAGEEFNRRAGSVKSLLRRFPQLEKDHNLNRGNRGITLVVL